MLTRNKLLYLLILLFVIIFSLKKKNIYENYENNIPQNIIQTWKNNNIPQNYINLTNSVKNNNKNYNYIFFTDNNIEIFLKNKYSKYYNTYLKLPLKIQKIDFFRYIALYHYGGFYMDLDMECIKSFNSLLNNYAVFPIDIIFTNKNINNIRYRKYLSTGLKGTVGQYAFACTTKNEFMKYLIDNIHNNINKIIKDYDILKNNKSNIRRYVYSSTGPDYVTDCFLKFKDRSKIKILDNNISQTFGTYATHKHMGTWK